MSTSIETVVLVAQNVNLLPRAREAISREAEVQAVSVDSVDESRRRFSTKLSVTVTGEADCLEAFRRALKGSVPAATPIDNVVGDLLDEGVHAVRKWWRSRSGRRPSS